MNCAFTLTVTEAITDACKSVIKKIEHDNCHAQIFLYKYII